MSSSTRISQSTWDSHRDSIVQLYCAEDLPLREVIRRMGEQHAFIASKSQYEATFKRWKIRKNLSAEEWRFVHERVEKRKRQGKDESVVLVEETLIPAKKVRKELCRHFPPTLTQGSYSVPSPQTPDGLSVQTPEGLVVVQTPAETRALQFSWFHLDDILEPCSLRGFSNSQLGPTSGNAKSLTEPTSLASVISQYTVSTKDVNLILDANPHLRALLPERRKGELISTHSGQLSPFRPESQFPMLKVAFYLLANNLLAEFRQDEILETLTGDPHFSWLKRFSKTQSPMTQMVASCLLRSTVRTAARVERGLRRSSCPFVLTRLHELLRIFLQCGADVNVTSNSSESMFIIDWKHDPLVVTAIRSGYAPMVLSLINAGADVNARLRDEKASALEVAARAGNIELVRLLLQSGADVNAQGSMGCMTALEQAVESGNVELVGLLIAEGMDLRSSHHGKRSRVRAFCTALSRRHHGLICVFLESGIDVNASPSQLNDGRTALPAAVRSGKTEVVELLLDHGADINASSLDHDADIHASSLDHYYAQPSNRTPFQVAAETGDLMVVQMLIDLGATTRCSNKRGGRTALTEAIRRGNMKLVRLLLERGADINSPAVWKHDCSSLEAAVTSGDPSVVRLVLERGADPNNIEPPLLERAASQGDVEIVQLLLTSSANHIDPALLAAARYGNACTMRLLLDKGAHINVQGWSGEGDMDDLVLALDMNEEGLDQLEKLDELDFFVEDLNDLDLRHKISPIHLAAENLELGYVQLLLDHGADVGIPAAGKQGTTVLQAALAPWHCEGDTAKRLEIVELLLTSGADVNAPAGWLAGSTALQAAVSAEGCCDQLEIVELLLARGADVNAPAGLVSGRTALQIAASQGSLSLVQLFITRRAAVNAPANRIKGATALQGAVRAGARKGSREFVEVVRLLLLNEADVNAPGAEVCGMTALQAACKGFNPELVELLLAHEADVNALASRIRGMTALQGAIGNDPEKCPLDVARLLLSVGADVNLPGAMVEGRTALQMACQRGLLECVELLLAKNADVNAAASRVAGVTALQAAAIGGYVAIAMRLLDAGADVNAPAAKFEGRTAIEGAAEHGRLDMVVLLLNAGAEANVVGPERFATAIQRATDEHHTTIARLLRDHQD